MSNILTIIRIIGTIPLLYLIYKDGLSIESFIIFIFLGLTDFFDGYLARKYNNCTNFGKIADGVADKFLMLGTTIVLLIKKVIPYWTLIIFIRDLIAIVFALYYKKKNNVIISSNIYGKLKTTFHIISIALVLLLCEWNIYSSILLIIAIFLFIPEIIYTLKYTKNK